MPVQLFAITPADAHYRRMLTIHQTCTEAKVEIPAAVQAFFQFDAKPEPVGQKFNLDGNAGVATFASNDSEGFEVYLDDLDPSIRVLRFVAGK